MAQGLSDQLGVLAQSVGQFRAPSPVDSIRNRLADLEKVRNNYVGYLAFRKSEEDWHGCWDASVNISETECEMVGLRWALDAIEGK